MSDLSYVGEELEIFAHALNWKRHYASLVRPYLGARILEVGAGLGTTTNALHVSQVSEWVCLEPDKAFAETLEKKISEGKLPSSCAVFHGTLQDLDSHDLYDTILYIDVLEHIESDHAEVQRAIQHLNPNGVLIVLSPAHQWLFTPFDESIGHFRRYSKHMLKQIEPKDAVLERIIYLDSVGMLLSLGNKLLLKQSMPTVKQILFWDRWVVPVSKVLDRLLMFRVGKSIVGIWRKS